MHKISVKLQVFFFPTYLPTWVSENDIFPSCEVVAKPLLCVSRPDSTSWSIRGEFPKHALVKAWYMTIFLVKFGIFRSFGYVMWWALLRRAVINREWVCANFPQNEIMCVVCTHKVIWPELLSWLEMFITGTMIFNHPGASLVCTYETNVPAFVVWHHWWAFEICFIPVSWWWAVCKSSSKSPNQINEQFH